MTAEDQDQPETPRRFSVAAARQHANDAYRKSEFILSRCYGLFRDPKGEWKQIRDEETMIPNILIGYVAPLAAIPIVCGILGSLMFERALFASWGDVIIRAAVTWVLSIGFVGFLGVVINVVSANFDADRNDLSAQKIAAYSLTPAFLSGVFSLWPPLWWLSLFALAAMVFLMYRGLPILMKAPEDRALGYAATVTIAALVVGVVAMALSSCFMHS